MYEVAIVGAGPAGATAGRYLTKLGHEVVLVDKDTFPRDKPCGGGFAESIINEFSYLKSRKDDFLKGICRVGVLHSPNRRIELRGRVDMAVALRYDFDNVLYESAIEMGVEALTDTRVKSISSHEDFVELDLSKGRSVRAKTVLGCDGVGSLVARSYGLHSRWPSHMITACRVAEVPEKETYINDVYSTDKDYHFYANLGGLPGYGWIFPKQDTINIGLGIVGTHAKGLPHLFNQFVSMLKRNKLLPHDADLTGAKGALVPTGGTIKQTAANRCILIGDSAGMVSPLTGGGIHYAMRAARFAANVISQGLEDDQLDVSNLMRYQTMWQSDFGKDFGPMLLAQKIFTGNFTDLLFEIGKRDSRIQEMVSEAMAESSDTGIDIPKLLARTIWIILRSVLHI
ncbi:MAG: NAD(P)/FAD-dependent oxidoreductase [Candidatus Thorarchaeota archaeon]|jgi:geranylgeranyl reductase family protein